MTTTTKSYNSQQSSNKGFILAIVAICILGAAAVAIVATSGAGSSDPDSVVQTAPVSIEGDALPQMPEVGGLTTAANDEAVGMVAPKLVGTDFEGNEVVIEADGRSKAVYFLAHWCVHCQAEAPRVQALIDAGSQPEGMDVYAVSTSVSAGRGNYPASKWLETGVGWTSPIMRDTESGEALVSYGAGGFPFVVYLDGNNTVLARSSGELDEAAIAAAWQLTASGVAS